MGSVSWGSVLKEGGVGLRGLKDMGRFVFCRQKCRWSEEPARPGDYVLPDYAIDLAIIINAKSGSVLELKGV